MKNTLKGTDKLDNEEQKISVLKYTAFEIIQIEGKNRQKGLLYQ
jgi:hypothetical protein